MKIIFKAHFFLRMQYSQSLVLLNSFHIFISPFSKYPLNRSFQKAGTNIFLERDILDSFKPVFHCSQTMIKLSNSSSRLEISIKGLQDKALDGISSVAASTSIYNLSHVLTLIEKEKLQINLLFFRVVSNFLFLDELSIQ